MSDGVAQPTSDDNREGWKAYWAAQGMPWRTEPEISQERQRYLAERRGVMSDFVKNLRPFRDENGPIRLDRADVEWLLATHEDGGLSGATGRRDPLQQEQEGLHLEGCDLRGAVLDEMPLDRTRFDGACVDEVSFKRASLQGASFYECHGAKADFRFASLEGANFSRGEFRGSVFSAARLDGSFFTQAALQQADFAFTDLRGAYLVEAKLGGADLRRCAFDARSDLTYASFGDSADGYMCVADANWGDVVLAGVNWEISGDVSERRHREVILGDEMLVRTPPPLGTGKAGLYYDLAAAIRAYLQLATILRSQGVDQQASEFLFRARVLQREFYWRERYYRRWLFSSILQSLAGYGLRPFRTLVWYVVVVTVSTAIYCWQGSLTAHPHTQAATILGIAVVESITAIHGRGFVPSETQNAWLLATAAFDALAGLVIEASFIATFTQRYFGR